MTKTPPQTSPPIAWDYPGPFTLEILVEPHHIDDFQHTNNVVYLGWMARTAWEHSKALGLDFDAYRRLDRGVVVRRHELDYIAPSHQGDRLLIATWITRNDGKLHLRRRFQMINAKTGKTLLRGLTDFVCIHLSTGRPARMPPEFAAAYRITAAVD